MKKYKAFLPKLSGCPFCFGKGVKFGKTSTGKVRCRCTVCHRTFGRKKHIPLTFSNLCQFRELITGKVNREKIIEEEQICRETLSGRFKNFFDYPVTPDWADNITAANNSKLLV